MTQHFIRAAGLVMAMAGLLSLCPDGAQAQTIGPGAFGGTDILSDPFTFYYAVYLPNQQLQAMRPTPLDSVNDALITRQYYTQGNRRGLTDPASPYADTVDPLRPYSSQQERLSRPFRFSHSPSNLQGTGPSLYFHRFTEYYPEMAGRTGRQRNANVYSGRTRLGGGRGGMGGMGGGGMGGMGGGGMGMGGGGMF
jgi:hypothetical protein